MEKQNIEETDGSPTLGKLFEALSKAQGEFTTPPKDNEVRFNGALKYKFANLATIIETNKGAMSKHGLSITQIKTFRGDRFGLLTVLAHSSGEYVLSFCPLPDPAKMKPQEYGSTLTYMRRYCYAAIQGIEGDIDDDGKMGSDATTNTAGNRSNSGKNAVLSKNSNSASGQGVQPRKIENKAPGMSDRVTVGELKVLGKIFKDKEFSNEQATQMIANEFGKKSVDLTKDEFHKACDLVQSLGLSLLDENVEGE